MQINKTVDTDKPVFKKFCDVKSNKKTNEMIKAHIESEKMSEMLKNATDIIDNAIQENNNFITENQSFFKRIYLFDFAANFFTCSSPKK